MTIDFCVYAGYIKLSLKKSWGFKRAVDLIILAFVAGFILYRLYTTLGEKTGFDPNSQQEGAEIVDFNTKRAKRSKASKPKTEEIPAHLRPAIQELTQVNPDFSLKDFVEGATVAFEMILDAYVQSDTKTLKKLLSTDLFKAFKGAIDDRKAEGHVLENTLVRVEEAEVEEANIVDNTIQLQVKFVTEQVPVIKDASGQIIEGNPNQIDQIIDHWTFERPLKSRDPNWKLVSTQV